MSRIQARAVELEWEHYRDTDRYHPLRDGPRQYAAVWVVETMRKYLPPEQVGLLSRLHGLSLRVQKGAASGGLSEVFIPSDQSKREHWLRVTGEVIRALDGFEAAARVRVGRDGELCYRGIMDGDSQAELCRRVGYAEASKRSIRHLVQITAQALSDYENDNTLDLQRWSIWA